MRAASLLLVAVSCALLVACGSGKGPKFAGTWSQKGSKFHARWDIPSASSIDLQLSGATSITGCTARLKGRSEPATILRVESDWAAFFKIGTTLQAGSKAQTDCQISGTVQSVSFGLSRLRHLKGR